MPSGYKHGLRYTPEYYVWLNLKQRCVNPNKWDYVYYGGRGITVCDEWLNSPETFVRDMGLRPSKVHQLDRENNDLGYNKDNCRWVEKTPQMQNTRLSKWWCVAGVRYASLTEAAESIGVVIGTIKKWCDGRSGGGYTYPPKANCWSEKKYG